MASLTGQSVASSYKDLLQVSNSNSGIDGTARVVSDGEDTASKLFLDTNRVGVGIAPTDGTLHVHTATAGSVTPDGDADDLVVENSASGGISILTPDANPGRLAFGSPSDAYGAVIMHQQSTGKLSINTEGGTGNISMATGSGVEALVIDSSQNVGIGISPVASQKLHVKVASDVNFTTSANSSSLRLNAVNDAVSATIPLEMNSSSTKFLSSVGIGGDASNQLDVFSAGDVVIGAKSTTNSSGNDAIFLANVAGSSAGDPMMRFNIDGVGAWSIGVDNDDSDNFKISGLSSVLGTNDRFIIDTSGNVSINTSAAYGNLTVGGTGEIISGRASSGAGSFSMYEAGTGRFVLESLNGSGGLAIKVPTTEVMRIESDGTADHKSNYIVNEQGRQNHVANTMSSPYYRFDSVDDLINLGSDANLDNIFDNGGTVAGWICPLSVGNDSGRVLDKNKWLLHQKSESGGFTKLQLYIYFDGNDGYWHTDSIIPNDKWTHIAVTYDNSSVSNNPVFYINGVSVTVTEEGTPTGTRDTDASESLYIGNKADGSRGFDGFMSGIQLWNTEISSSEAKELYSGASVPYKYKGANQTNILGSLDFNSGWTNVSSNMTINSATSITAGATNSLILKNYGALTAGKNYRVRIAGTIDSGVLKVQDVNGSATILTTTSSTFDDSVEFTYPSGSTNRQPIAILIATNGATANITHFSYTQIGAVAEYDGSSAGSKVWGDKSGNGLHGTVGAGTLDATAPTLENTPYDAETEYEEGTFTPAWVAGTGSFSGTISYQNRVGKYVKIGNAVHITISFYNNEFASTGGSGSIKIGGLPYTASAKCALALGDTRLFNDDNPSEAEVGNGTTNVILYIRDGNADVANSELQVADLLTGSGIVGNLVTLSGTYFT